MARLFLFLLFLLSLFHFCSSSPPFIIIPPPSVLLSDFVVWNSIWNDLVGPEPKNLYYKDVCTDSLNLQNLVSFKNTFLPELSDNQVFLDSFNRTILECAAVINQIWFNVTHPNVSLGSFVPGCIDHDFLRIDCFEDLRGIRRIRRM